MLSSIPVKKRFWQSLSGVFCLPLLFSACVSVPDPIAKEPQSVVSISQVQSDASAYSGQQVRWGGTIVGVVNNEGSSDVLIVSRPLSRIQRPVASDKSSGRFIARVPAFIEPETYTDGREVTIIGTVAGIESLPVGQTQYDYPIIAVDGKHLWSKRSSRNTTYPYPYHHGYPHSHHLGFWWEDDHRHRHGSGVFGSLFYHGRL